MIRVACSPERGAPLIGGLRKGITIQYFYAIYLAARRHVPYSTKKPLGWSVGEEVQVIKGADCSRKSYPLKFPDTRGGAHPGI